jgi:hypothetical protein
MSNRIRRHACAAEKPSAHVGLYLFSDTAAPAPSCPKHTMLPDVIRLVTCLYGARDREPAPGNHKGVFSNLSQFRQILFN